MWLVASLVLLIVGTGAIVLAGCQTMFGKMRVARAIWLILFGLIALGTAVLCDKFSQYAKF